MILSRGRNPILALLVALLCNAAAPSALGQTGSGTVQVRSGNHAQFARLVFVYPDRRAWSLLPTETGYRLKIERAAGFGLSGVFDLIPRNRIAALEDQTDGAVAIEVACACHADVIELPGRGLVLDIRDGPAPPGNPFELLRDAAVETAVSRSDAPLPDLIGVAEPQLAPRLRFDSGLSPPVQQLDGWPLGIPVARPVAAGAVLPEPGSPPQPQRGAVAGRADAEGPEAPEPEDDRAVIPQASVPPVVPAVETVPGSGTVDQAAPATAGPGIPLRDGAPLAEPSPALATTSATEAVAPAARWESGAAVTEDASTREVPVSALEPPPRRPGRDATSARVQPDRSDDRPGRWVQAPAVDEPELPSASVAATGGDIGRIEPTEGSIRLPPVVQVQPGADLLRMLPMRPAEQRPAPDARAEEFASAFGTLLAEQVGRGLTQGVVDPNRAVLDARTAAHAARDNPQSTAPDQQTLASRGPEADEQDDDAVADANRDPADQIRIVTAVDRLVAESGSGEGVVRGTPLCLPDTALDVASWIPAAETRPDFGPSRAALLGEFDRVSDAALETAVQYQIAYGFGAEARQLLDSFLSASGLSDDRARILRALSHIVDGETGAQTDALSDQLGCPTRASIWGALARPNLQPDADYSREAVLKAFEELPTGLRRGLGPHLASRFLEIGDMETVSALRRSIARIDLPTDAASEIAREAGTFLEARIEASVGDHAAAEARLAEVARLDGQLAKEAVADLVESILERGGIPDESLVASAAAMAFEFRGSEVGQRLRRGEILSLVLREDFGSAFAELRRAVDRAELPSDTMAEIATHYVETLTARATDRAFLARAPMELPVLLDLGTGTEARIAAANRMTDLGLPEAALPLVEGLRRDPDARIAAAQAWLRLADPAAALTRLAGLEGDTATRLRAEAYSALGDPSAAADVLDRIGETHAASNAAWRAGDIARVADDPQAIRAALAGLAAGVPLQAPATTESLSEHQQLIEGATRLRETIAAELARDFRAEPE
jgi:hypothetical protein